MVGFSKCILRVCLLVGRIVNLVVGLLEPCVIQKELFFSAMKTKQVIFFANLIFLIIL